MPGDIIFGYMATPRRQIVARCKVTKGLHNSPTGEAFEFEKIEHLPNPISLVDLQAISELKNCEPLINNQGSLFKLRPEEFEIIQNLIDEANEDTLGPLKLAQKYTLDECTNESGYSKSTIQRWLNTIERKKQAIFYGPPGTGKTYLSHRIAKLIISDTDGFIEFVQFHPAYTYEDFIQGIRPKTDDKGDLQFEMKSGRFFEFCTMARQHKGPCVLIIDEINRANIPRVFGELMYLLEYREKDIPLAGGMRFIIPDNVRILGTMNTADRSIALVDFALRRRFAFLELTPEYDILREFQKIRGFSTDGLVATLQEINAKINDKNYYLGISFFMIDDLPKKLEDIWKMEIETYLDEYFFSQPENVINYRWDKVKGRILP